MGRMHIYALATVAALAASQARPRDDVMIGAYRCAGIAGPQKPWTDRL